MPETASDDRSCRPYEPDRDRSRLHTKAELLLNHRTLVYIQMLVTFAHMQPSPLFGNVALGP